MLIRGGPSNADGRVVVTSPNKPYTTVRHRLAAERLALEGGIPIRPADRPWPRWPVAADSAPALLRNVLESSRWAITSPVGSELYERQFARSFADYLGAGHCVPVDHGSSALVVALESLGLSHGDVVVVPALTWVATASAVLRAGLVPVLADVDQQFGVLTPEMVISADAGARAIVAVHWACTMADIPAIEAAVGQSVPVVEDAAQAHGARWAGRAAGTIGRVGCFSMQQSKVLTAGEGGAVVTDDEALARRAEELRADSRRYTSGVAAAQGMELEESATVMGANFCLNEFSAALLCAQLGDLDAQNAVRARNHRLLADLVVDVPGVRLIGPRPEQTRQSIYEMAIVFDTLPEGRTNRDVAEALTAELHTLFHPPREPLQRSPFLQPWTKPALDPLTRRFVAEHRDRRYPNAEHLAAHAVLTHHSTLLGNERDVRDIAAAIEKVAISGPR